MASDEGHAQDGGTIEKLEASARGWHSIQLAVLGFIGLCGVLQSSGGAGLPMWLQILAAGLVFLALILSCLSISLVGTVAWPIYAGRPKRDEAPDDSRVDRAARRLRVGIAMTFVAVAALAAGSTSAWWPDEDKPSSSVQVATRAGVLCGTLVDAERGSVGVAVADRTLVVSLDEVSAIRPVSGCS